MAYLLAASFFMLEIFLRQGAAAKSLKTSGSDGGSTILIGVSFGVAIVLPLVLNAFRLGQMSSSIFQWIGLSMMLLGLALRVWSMSVLGTYYSRTLRVSQAQTIVSQGPYRVIRHPGYLGTIVVWIGFSLALSNWIATLVVTAAMFGVYAYRIRTEEAMLLTQFGEAYQAYSQGTWRLLPFLY
jgi:protein-S-isoprenylcysteine O-methyltransferase Ste14